MKIRQSLIYLGIITVSVAAGYGASLFPVTAIAKETSRQEKIQSATYLSAKVYFNGEEIPLKRSLVQVSSNDGSDTVLYMPMQELLEYMNFQVEWKAGDNRVDLTMNGYGGQRTEDPAGLPQNETDQTALDIMQRTGNWGYIEPYLPYMSKTGIDAVVACYNSKHMNVQEHKKAADYYN